MAKHPNPTFLAMEHRAMIHYGTDPLLGFHLAAAYAPLRPDDPVSDQIKDLPRLEKVVAVARIEFRHWISSYRKRAADIRIRFFTGDAISFAHTLQHKRATKSDTAHWYRNRHGLQPLILDGPDYTSLAAPLDFDVIDTSNLCDHIGSLTLLTAISPLLRNHASSILFTEVLVKRNRTHQQVFDDILCGHVPTVSTLLDLFPVEYWTNTSSTSQADEAMLNLATRSKSLQIFLRTSWKRPPHTAPLVRPFKIRFEEDGLAKVLYQVYDYMFCQEGLASPGTVKGSSVAWYHRASFASFLRLVQTRVTCNWDKTMNNLMTLIASRHNALMDLHYIQELHAYLHMMGIFSSDFHMQFHSRTDEGRAISASPRLAFPPSRTTPMGEEQGDLRSWKNIPSVVCVTLKVPRDKIDVPAGRSSFRLGTSAPIHCFLQSARYPKSGAWYNIFSACQLAFGDITTRGKRHSDSFEVSVLEDDAGWDGDSDLIAVFYMPARYLLPESRVAKIVFGACTTIWTERELVSGPDERLSIYETTVENSEAVYITRYGPNQTQFPVATGFAQTAPAEPTDDIGANASLEAGVDQKTGRITTFTARLDMTADDRKLALKNRCEVQKSTVSPCEVAIHVGNTTPLVLSFPVFVVEAHQTIRVARKSSSYVEVIAEVAGPSEWREYPHYMYPIHLDQGRPINWNMPYLDLQTCPIIDHNQRDKLDWLSSHMLVMMSARERAMCEEKASCEERALPQSAGEQLRLDFKESQFSLFTRFPGLLHDDKHHVFGLGTTADIHVVILVSSLRINLADRAVVLDCAIIPLHEEMYSGFEISLTQLMRDMLVIKVSDEELRLWRRVLPTYVERCRTWTHRADCEYKRSNSIPLATENYRQVLCTCGHGDFPPNFIDVANWDAIAKYAVRAAISPAYWAPFVDELIRDSGDSGAGDAGRESLADDVHLAVGTYGKTGVL
ncbi:hypothetical protein F5B18DRAFT_635582 [Nemania serpens]|nr:hypothetical protein F5B18DRAFT_635582 [Nemania serpens]